jgi:sulfur carrier protein ThiS
MTHYGNKTMDEAVPQLRAQLSKSNTDDPFENGTVLRFAFKTYTIVVLKVGEQWYTTSSREAFMPKVLSYADLLEYMAYAPRSVAVAINWMKAVHAQ